MDIKNAIDRGIDFLAHTQLSDGGFESFSSPTILPFQSQFTYRTTFIPALILAAISSVHTPEATKVRAKLATFLMAQKSARWSFGYWARDSNEASQLPYPDDMDDTACTLRALWLHDKSLITEAVLANMARNLIATEAQAGGPYRTWLTPNNDPVWRDVDVAVNANIAHLLSLVARPLPHLTHFLEEAVTNKLFKSPYYPDSLPVVYYLARVYDGPKKNELAAWILTSKWQLPMHLALAVSSLTRLDASLPITMVNELLRTQQTNGSWPSAAFCIDPKRDKKNFYHGSPALSTALAIEALSTSQVHEAPLRPRRPIPPSNPLFNRIINRAKAEFEHLGDDLRVSALRVLDTTVQSRQSQEIVLMPELFYSALVDPPVLSDDILLELGLANTFGWMAYTIYDDFLDDEGQLPLLSVANVAMRQSIRAFRRALPEHASFQKNVDQTFDIMDAANVWEVTHCRQPVKNGVLELGTLPTYRSLSRLADRSLGHTLTPLAILACSSTPAIKVQAIRKGLRHYIAARQLNDDAHDWRDDLQAGRMTTVVTHILRGLGCKPGPLSLASFMPLAERCFWHRTLPAVCDNITKHLALSRQALSQSHLLKSPNTLDLLLDRTEVSVAETRKMLAQAEKFLQAYQK